MRKINLTEPHDPSCAVTILEAPKNRLLCKKFIHHPGGDIETVQYGRAIVFRHQRYLVDSVHTLGKLIKKLEKFPHHCIVRGDFLPEHQGKISYRRKDSYLIESPKRWALIDSDSIECPACIDPLIEPYKAIEYLVSFLPKEFWAAPCFWQWSSSFGVFPTKLLKAHLWYFFDRPYSNDEMRGWAMWVNEKSGHKIIDPALFNVVQPHYTAAPVFVGMNDPVSMRSGFYKGKT